MHDASARVRNLADDYVREYFAAFPQHALLFGAPDTYPDRLENHSFVALQVWQTREDELLTELRSLDISDLEGAPVVLTYRLLKNQLEAAQRCRVCRMELWNVSPTYTGWQSRLAVLASLQPTETPAQRKQAVERFSQIPRYLEEEIGNLREGMRLGYLAPKSNVRTVIGQMEALLAAPSSESPFVQMAHRDNLEFQIQLNHLEEVEIKPAIKRYRDYLRDEYLPAAREAVGVGANPNGADCYRAAIRYHTTTEMTPEAIYALGLQQMEKTSAEMRKIGEERFGTGDIDSLITLAKADPAYHFSGREAIVAFAEAAVERARQAIPGWFGRVTDAPIEVKPFPAFQEKSAPGGQSIPQSADGSKPAIYLINTYQAERKSRVGVEATTFHETYPGHHLQGSIALEREGLHPIARYFDLSGFGEGWALYSERLADEMGLYTSEVDRLAMLSAEAGRAARLVVDPGIHVLWWTRQQAIDYFIEHTAITVTRAEAEIDKIIAVPGQATSYMIGNLEIRRLREEAEQALGASFEIRAFHDMVLEDGAVPLWVLREKAGAWIGQQRKR